MPLPSSRIENPMKYLWILFLVVGLWFLASAATEQGLLPSGHGVSRTAEIIAGIVMVGYAVFRLAKRRSSNKG